MFIFGGHVVYRENEEKRSCSVAVGFVGKLMVSLWLDLFILRRKFVAF